MILIHAFDLETEKRLSLKKRKEIISFLKRCTKLKTLLAAEAKITNQLEDNLFLLKGKK